jgi:hypothetical protein
MKLRIALACIVLLFACGGDDDKPKRAAVQETKETPPPPAPKDTPPPAAKPAKPPEPDPTTPAELDKAFKQAMIDGREKDVLHYCEMLKLDDKSNPQSLMGCALAACRSKDADTVKRYVAPLSASKTGKQLLVQVKKVCLSNNVSL